MKENTLKLPVKAALTDAFPIIIGYLSIAIAFGLVAKTVGITLAQAGAISTFVYAGASQFMALNLLSLGAGLGEIIITTLLVNLRHFLMSASLITRLEKPAGKLTPLMAFWVTDEVFSVLSMKKERLGRSYVLLVQLAAYGSWITGTVIGYIAGGLLPEILAYSMVISLYSMFVAILVPALKTSMKAVIIAASAAAANTILTYAAILPKSWNLVIAIVAAAALGTFLYGSKEVEAHE